VIMNVLLCCDLNVSHSLPHNSLMTDFQCFVLPNALRHTFTGHSGAVKALDFLGRASDGGAGGQYLVSGGSDGVVRIWEAEPSSTASASGASSHSNANACVRALTGHTSRIWDVAAARNASIVASASGDSTIRVRTSFFVAVLCCVRSNRFIIPLFSFFLF
jgi:COMPASS component SWD3